MRSSSRLPSRRLSPVRLDERGQGLTEYLILMVLVAVVAIGATRTVGRAVKDRMELVGRQIEGLTMRD